MFPSSFLFLFVAAQREKETKQRKREKLRDWRQCDLPGVQCFGID
jgi:hypothetical protein